MQLIQTPNQFKITIKKKKTTQLTTQKMQEKIFGVGEDDILRFKGLTRSTNRIQYPVEIQINLNKGSEYLPRKKENKKTNQF